MTHIKEDELCICVKDRSPEERREYLIKACASAMRWYALNPDKRKTDHDHAAAISDLLEELAEISF